MSNIHVFKADLNKFADKVNLSAGQFRQRVTLDLKDKIEQRTPVDTGRLRSSWAVSDGQPSSYVPPEGTSSGPAPVQARFQEPFNISYITSNLAYAMPIEYGHSKQTPNGMIRVSLAELITELEFSFGKL